MIRAATKRFTGGVRPTQQGTGTALAALLLCGALCGCTRSGPESSPDIERGKESTEADPPSDALQELEQKLQPGGGEAATTKPEPEKASAGAPTPPETEPAPGSAEDKPAEERPERSVVDVPPAKLIEEAAKLADELTKHLAAGDAEKAKSLLVSDAQLKEILTDGHYGILGGTVIPRNRQIIDDILETVAGKKLEARFERGSLSRTLQSVFRSVGPILNDSRIILDVDGAPVVIQLKQLIWTNDGWRIFQLAL